MFYVFFLSCVCYAFRRWAVLSYVQPPDKYISKSVSQVALFAYSPICETLHTKIIYL